MNSTRAFVGVVTVMAGIVLAGCHSSSPTPILGDEVLNAAIDAPLAMRPVRSSTEAECSQGLLLLMSDPPQTREEIATALSDWTAAATIHPNDAACQLGLCLMMVARAADNMATDLGYDLFEGARLESASPLALMALAASEQPGGLAAAHAQSLRVCSGGVNTAQLGLLVSIDMDVQAAIREYLLPTLYTARGSVHDRLSAFTAPSGAVPLITLGNADGVLATMHPADFRLMCAGVAGLSGLLSEMCAYNTDAGRWAPAPTIGEMDLNADSTLTPDEYMPPAPYATLNPDGAARMSAAHTAYRAAVTSARTGLDTIPDDPFDLLRMLFIEAPPLPEEINAARVVSPRLPIDEFRLVLDHLDALLAGSQQVTIEYWTEGSAHEQLDFTVDITRIYLHPLADMRSIMPALPLVEVPLATADVDTPLRPILEMFPDLTFNGVVPELEQLTNVLETADYVTLVHGDRDWGVTDLAGFHLLTEDLRMALGGDDFGFPTELTSDDLAILPDILFFLIIDLVAF